MEIKTDFIWRNSEVIAWDEARDHNLTHSLHYGWACFEGIRFYNTDKWPKIFKLSQHIDRLFYSAGVLNITIPYTKEQIMADTIELVKKNNVSAWYIRHIVYSWYGKMWLNPTWANTEVVISVWKWWKYLSDNPIRVKISKTRRIHPDTTDMKAKISGNYANSILVSHETKASWFDEWLLLDTTWFIAEWPGENIFFVKWNKVITPSLWTILPWITRASVIELLKNELWIVVIEQKISPDDLAWFDESFFTWTAAEVTPIWSITTEAWVTCVFQTWKEGSLTGKIKALYNDVVTWKEEKYLNWLY